MAQNRKKESELDVSKAALSIHGDFFQQRCLEEARKAGWVVLAEEYPTSLGVSYGSLDIWAALVPLGEGVNLLIECKKSHPGYRRWVFLSKPPRVDFSFPSVKMRKDSLSSSDPRIDPYKATELAGLDPRFEPNICTDFLKVDPSRLQVEAFAYGAHEIRLDSREVDIIRSYEEASRARERPPHERIYHGCRQLALATKSIMLEELRLMEKRMYVGIQHPKLFVPVLVTNADLVSCAIDPGGIDLLTGEIREARAVKLTKTNIVTYHFPLPEEFYLYPQDVRGDRHVPFLASASLMEGFKKLFILVVRSSSLENLLQNLKFYSKGLR